MVSDEFPENPPDHPFPFLINTMQDFVLVKPTPIFLSYNLET